MKLKVIPETTLVIFIIGISTACTYNPGPVQQTKIPNQPIQTSTQKDTSVKLDSTQSVGLNPEVTNQNKTLVKSEDTSTQKPSVTQTSTSILSEYFPLKVGYKWEYWEASNDLNRYRVEIVAEKNNKYIAKYTGGNRDGQFVGYEIKANKIIEYVCRDVRSANQAFEFIENDKKGLYNKTILQLPLKVGTKWDDGVEVQIDSLDSIIDGIYKSFRGMLVSRYMGAGTSWNQTAFEKNIGIVRINSNVKGNPDTSYILAQYVTSETYALEVNPIDKELLKIPSERQD